MISTVLLQECSSEADPGIDPAIVLFVTAAKRILPRIAPPQECSKPSTVVARAREFWKSSHTREDRGFLGQTH